MIICKEDMCTGCLACVDICRVGAISVKKNKQGFDYPVISEDKCLNCGKCASICPVNVQKKNGMTKTPYACWDKEKTERKAATSGGIFTVLAKQIISDGGVVYGAAFDENLDVIHTRIDEKNKINSLRGSKYVQSNTLHIYEKVKIDLDNGRKVLFSGMPCQVAALKNYVGKDYSNLLLVDIMCHGVPSPIIFSDYKHWLENKFNSKLLSLNFRYKRPSWTIFSMLGNFENGKRYIASKYRDPYHCFFLLWGGDLTLRNSCFGCQFTSPERVGDITLADFWQYRARCISSGGSEKYGVNLVLINTDKGKVIFDKIKNRINIEEHSWDEAYKSNMQLIKPNLKPIRYEEFWNTYYSYGFNKILDEYWKPDKKGELRTFIITWKRAHEYLLPKCLRK